MVSYKFRENYPPVPVWDRLAPVGHDFPLDSHVELQIAGNLSCTTGRSILSRCEVYWVERNLT